MSDRIETEIDRRLGEIARDAAMAVPEPSDALMARILADAADVAAETQAAVPPVVRSAPERRFNWSSLRAILPVWTGGALAMMALGLILGLSLGYGYGDQAMAVSTRAQLETFAEFSDFTDFEDTFLAMEGPF